MALRITLFLAFLALAGCASQSQQASDPASFDGQKMAKVGQTKQEVESVWGKPDRTRLNSDGSSADLFVPDKWKFAAPFYGMAARVHALGRQVWALIPVPRPTDSQRVSKNPLTSPAYTVEVDLFRPARRSMSFG